MHAKQQWIDHPCESLFNKTVAIHEEALNRNGLDFRIKKTAENAELRRVKPSQPVRSRVPEFHIKNPFRE
jgi:hypothetical protein